MNAPISRNYAYLFWPLIHVKIALTLLLGFMKKGARNSYLIQHLVPVYVV